jgi:hypothetical protein
MDGLTLQDRIYRGYGKAAVCIGIDCDLFRPVGPFLPLAPENRIMRLPVAFLPVGGRVKRPVPQTDPYWEGVFDAAYAEPGDILRRRTDAAIFFVAAKQALLPVLCVRALRTITINRPSTANAAGLNLYGGTVAAFDTTLAVDWPASVEITAGTGIATAGIQSELTPGAWEVLLPASLKLQLQIGDILTDDEGRIGVISVAETTDLGTRLTVKQAST